MIPTKEQTLAGWRTLPDRETWDAHVARGGVWMWQDGTDLYVRRSPQYPPPQTYTDCVWLPADPATYAYWPLPGAVPTEPGLWERRDRAVPVPVRIERDFVGHDGDLGPEYLAWLSDHDLDGSSIWSPVTPDGYWIGPFVKMRG